ncbi:proton pump-interactor BIP103-like [Cajanus cajan]|uniref:proton pump-interactor BIP103-like n=1 Tax=Cajanus cajan TaxID=3821 RepID=UPI00098DD1AE|nr:proton pump-interactor BIP103-like [Cajanus cajan]
MEQTISHSNPSLESDVQNDFFPTTEFEVESELDGRTNVNDDSGHVSKLVHRFYFVKLWPTNPDSVSEIKKKESVIEKMNHDIREITERIKEKMMLNSLMLCGSKNLAEEKQILTDVNIQERDSDSFKSLEMLEKTIRWNTYLNDWQKLLREIEQFLERASGNASVKGKISSSGSLRKAIKDEIKHLCDDSLENRRNLIAHAIRVIHAQKELEAIDKLIYSLRTKLTERRQKKGQAYQSISKLKKFYEGEVIHYYQYCSLVNKVHQLAKEKDVAALDEISHSEVGKFMLEWNSNKAFREDYEKKVVQSLKSRQLSRDGRRKPR